MTEDQATLTVHGDDRPGIVAAVSATLSGLGANIVSLDQYTDDPDGGRFFQRTVFRLPRVADRRTEIEHAIEKNVARPFGLEWSLVDRATPKRVAILASTSDHCLLDLLWRQRRGEIPMNIVRVISNHAALEDDVRSFGVPYTHIPSQGPDKSAAEAAIVELLQGDVDLVVLARYMQILSSDFLIDIGVPVINIHHSFLPAFIGAGPYRKAKERGVKLIGATAHYVTEDLDEGPIIEQDVVRITHADTAADLQRKGAYVERDVLSRAVLAHCEDRVIRNGRETVVF